MSVKTDEWAGYARVTTTETTTTTTTTTTTRFRCLVSGAEFAPSAEMAVQFCGRKCPQDCDGSAPSPSQSYALGADGVADLVREVGCFYLVRDAHGEWYPAEVVAAS
jgi:hypothetical protein